MAEHARLLDTATTDSDRTYIPEVRAEKEKLYNNINKNLSLLIFRISDM